MARFRRSLPHNLEPDAADLLDRIGDAFLISQTKALKEDLMAVREAGGLLGQVVCVRKADLPQEVLQFAQMNQIEVVRKTELVSRLDSLLHPNRKAGPDDLRSLVENFGRR